ncbi:class E sortase [Streptomyces sp. H39-S7]|uniref:class E sortase n=1 Tax=Streptomyces sp. H39-S7 TaxID=3004357 RepID=UPI003FA6985F
MPQQAPQDPPPAPQATAQAATSPPAYDAAYDEGYGAGYAGTYEGRYEGGYEGGYDSGYAAGPAAPPEPEPAVLSEPAPVSEPAPAPPPRVRRRGVPGETAQFPAVRPDGTPDESAETAETSDSDASVAVGEPTPAEVTAPAPGGRAERRKAAKQGVGHRARGRAASGSPAGPGAAQAAPAVPMTRLEARRAERAAKDSPAVILSRVIGEVFISVGVLMLLFVTYQLWWTNIRAHQQASGATSALQNQWDKDKDKGEQKSGDDRAAGAFSPGQGFAIMYIPKLDVKAPIAEGISKHNVLDKGMVGHYTGALKTAMPWDKQGNFALAAHRNTHGEPFRYINKLVPGDKIVVETESTFYTYEMTSVLPSTSPSNVKVIQPIPPGSGFTKPGRYITLTTCTPEFTSTYRMIVWGKMVEERPRSQGKPAALPD